MKRMFSVLIILVLITTGLGFTSPELQNKEIDFGNDIKYIDGVVDLDFSEEGNFIKSEEVQLEFKNFVINKAQKE